MKKISASLIVVAILAATIIFTHKEKESTVFMDSLMVLHESNAGLERFKLENGMTCLLKEDHSAPTVSIQFWVGTGSIHEQEYLGTGLSHGIEHMIFKGTAKRLPGDIFREINDAGGDMNAYTSFDRTVFHTDIPSRNWEIGLDVLSDALMNAAFPEEEWTKEKEVIVREIVMGRDNPERVISKLLFDTAYSTHPYKYPVIGYEDTFRRITSTDIQKFFKRHYIPGNVIAVIVGDINKDEVRSKLASTFAGFARQPYSPVVLPVEPIQISPRFARNTGTYNVTRMEMAYHTVAMNHPDAPALDMLAVITGLGRSSKLSRNIMERQKLVHTIDAWSYTLKEPGLFGISASFDPKNEKRAIAAIENEIASWKNKPFSIGEIEKAKRQLLNNELSSLQNMSGQANSYASGEFYAADPRYSETYLRSLNRVTPETLMKVARNYLEPDARSVVILSPIDETTTNNSTQRQSPTQPDIEMSKLPNGTRLLTREDHRLPFIYLCVAFEGGLLSETESNTGITQLMSDLLTRGTETRSSEEIADITESLGATLTTFAGRNSFGIQLQCLSGDAETLMDLVSDCLLNPAFSEEQIEKQKKIQIAAIERQYEQPLFIAQTTLKKSLLPNHPYQWDPLGYKETVSAITRNGLQEHARKYIVSGNTAISIFGDVTPDQSSKLAGKYFSGIPKGPQASFALAKPEPTLPSRIKQREPREQAIVLMGFPGIDIKDSRHDAITLLQTMMSGLSSELSTKIREERGLAYYSGAYDMSGVEPGIFVLYAGTREDAVPEVEKIMQDEIQRILSSGLKQDELDRARNQLVADFENQLQNSGTTAMICALNELYGLGYDHLFHTEERLNALTLSNITTSAKSILSLDHNAVSLILPLKEGTDNE